PPRSTPFPYTTLFRSRNARGVRLSVDHGGLTAIVCQTAYAPTYTRTVKSLWLAVGIALVLATAAHAAPDLTAPQALPRVEHHVRSEEHTSELQSRSDL